MTELVQLANSAMSASFLFIGSCCHSRCPAEAEHKIPYCTAPILLGTYSWVLGV